MAHRKSVNTMWLDAVNLLERADQLQRQFFQLGAASRRGPTWEPPTDIFESDDTLFVVVALPGISPDRLSVTLENDTLCITGVRPMPAASLGRLRRLEIPYGTFERRIRLAPGHFKILASHLKEGCLHLTLQKLS